MGDLIDFEAVLDKVGSDNGRISWDRVTVEVCAESEAEAREQIANDMPDYTIYSIKKA